MRLDVFKINFLYFVDRFAIHAVSKWAGNVCEWLNIQVLYASTAKAPAKGYELQVKYPELHKDGFRACASPSKTVKQRSAGPFFVVIFRQDLSAAKPICVHIISLL